jgi:hypothetical protein
MLGLRRELVQAAVAAAFLGGFLGVVAVPRQARSRERVPPAPQLQMRLLPVLVGGLPM